MNDIKRIVKRSGSSFFWCMRFLPLAKRNAMYTIYAFCRHIDDVVDENDLSMSEKLDLIQAWRVELDNIYEKKVPTTDIGRKIYKNCMRFKLPKEELLRLVNGVAMDIPNPIQAPSMEEFYTYCRGVAGAPGVLTLRILGCDDEKLINDLATSLGNALQITNILRDETNSKLQINCEILKKMLMLTSYIFLKKFCSKRRLNQLLQTKLLRTKTLPLRARLWQKLQKIIIKKRMN